MYCVGCDINLTFSKTTKIGWVLISKIGMTSESDFSPILTGRWKLDIGTTKGAFFQEVWFVFQISKSPKKNIPINYPKLEIQISRQ